MSPTLQVLFAFAALPAYGIGIGIASALVDPDDGDDAWPWCVFWPIPLVALTVFLVTAGPGLLMFRLVKGRWPE